MKGSWAKSRQVSRNSCALFHRSRAVLSPRTQQPHPRREGEGGVGEMWPPRCCSGAGRTARSVTARRKGRATRRDGNGTCHRRGAGALLGSGAHRTERGGSPRRESDTARWERDVPSQWSGWRRGRGSGRSGAHDRRLRARRGRIRSEDRHRPGRRLDARRGRRAAWGGSCCRDAHRADGLRDARAVWHRRRG